MRRLGFVIFVTSAFIFSACTKEQVINEPIMVQPEELPGETVPEGVPGESVVVTPSTLDGRSEVEDEMGQIEKDLNAVDLEFDNNIDIDE